MFGPLSEATIPHECPSRRRAVAWAAVLAFGFAQLLVSVHVHASTGTDEPPEALCAACAFADDGRLAGLSSGQAASLLRQCAAKPLPPGFVIERQAHCFLSRAPPSS